jgi:transposase InsO family protein
MGQRTSLSVVEKEQIYRGKLNGKTIAAMAQAVGCSWGCARKWWRIGRDQGQAALRAARRGRGSRGVLSRFDLSVRVQAVVLKQAHPKWGADRVKVELSQDPAYRGQPLPSRSRLATYFKQVCPEKVAGRTPRPPAPLPPRPVQGVHVVWQLDSQENIGLGNGEIATICNIHDPFSGAMIASRAFSVKTHRGWRKLDWTEIRQVLRAAFEEWGTLPDGVQTDNELALAGAPQEPYPGRLTLWLVGLGIRHRLIRPGHPTDQPHIERNHRSLDDFALNDEALRDLPHLQAALDYERSQYNHHFPAHAGNCQGQPPLVAHPELLQPHRPFRSGQEAVLFQLQWVYDYLASFTFARKINGASQVHLGGQPYYLKRRWVRALPSREIHVHLDAEHQEWLFLVHPDQPEVSFARLPLKLLDRRTLTDLDPLPIPSDHYVQLTLPFLVP